MAKVAKLTPQGVLESNVLLSETHKGNNVLKLRGTGLNRNTASYLYFNDTAIYNVASGRGIRLTIFNADLTVKSTSLYDIYGNDEHRTNLAAAIDGLLDDEIFCMTSWDAINTNTALTAAMTTINATLFLKKSTYGSVRMPYCCVGTGFLGVIAERIERDSTDAPYADLEIAFDSHMDIGSAGFGKPLAAHPLEKTYVGSDYGFLGLNIDKSNLRDGEWIRLKCDLKIDQARKDLNGTVAAYIYTRTANDSWCRSTSTARSNTEYVSIELIFQYRDEEYNSHDDINEPVSAVVASFYQMPNSIKGGTCFVRNIEVYRCGRTNFANRKSLTMNAHAVSSPWLDESAQSGDKKMQLSTSLKTHGFKEV